MQQEVRNLSAPSAVSQFIDPKTGALTVLGHRFLQLLWERTGGSSGSNIYDTIDLGQSTSASEAQLFAVRQELESQLQGIVLQVIEQVREQNLDPSSLISDVSSGGLYQQIVDNVLSSADHIDFSQTPVVSAQTARLLWNDTDGTLDLGLKGGNVTLQLGQEQLLRCLNKSGADFVDGQAVYISGAQGNRTTIELADADTVTVHKTIGIVTEHILNNQEGFVTINGMVRDIDTSAWAEGDQLWVSSTAGALTNVQPVPPKHSTSIGYVVRSHATNGSIFVSTQPGIDLTDCDDVLITGVANNDALVYDSGTSLWTNRTSTGTGSNVLATSPTLVTPAIGAATGSSLVLTGNASAAAFIPTSTAVPTNGMYLLAADQTAFTSGGTRFLSSNTTVTTFPLDIALTRGSSTTVRRGDVTGYLAISGGGAVNTGMNWLIGGQTTSSFAGLAVLRYDTTELLRVTSAGLFGMNMTPGHVLDITKNQAATSAIRLLNNDAGAAADSRLILSNGTNTAAAMLLRGTGHATEANALVLSSGGAYPLHIYTNSAKKATVDTTGNLVMLKTQGVGIKVDAAGTPTFGWHDIMGQLFARGSGATDPVWTTYRGNIRQYEFHAGDEIWVTWHLPHDYVMGTDIYCHGHWSHISSTVTTGSVVWGFESTYAKGYNQDQFDAPVTTTVTQAAPTGATGQYRHMIAETPISVAGGSATLLDSTLFEPDGIILCRIYLVSESLDGGVTSVFLHTADAHYQSTSLPTKQKNGPAFWT